MRPLPLTGRDLTIADVEAVARGRRAVKLHPDAAARMRASRAVIERVVADGATVYGVTTGFGDLADVRIEPAQTADLQRNLGGIAVSLGPGLYTGMRIGVSGAKALAQALSVPIVGMASLDLLAYEVRYSPKTICAAIDARRNEVFHAFYRTSPGGIQRMTEYRVERPERLAVGIDSRPEEVLIVGSGALLHKHIFEDLRSISELGTMSHAFPDARALVELALPRMFRGEFDKLDDVRPLYLRRSARRIEWERVRGRTA
jgi:tRNA threonylcarbamoyladenosine biosynthesis protein TsaB